MLRITNTKFNNQEVNAVSARELHLGLELKTEFTNWTKQFLEDFIQDIDFIRNEGKLNPTNHVPLIDYLFTLDMAKQIAMLTRTAKGKEIRLYFIECEKQLKQLKPALSNLSPQLQFLIKLEQEQNELKLAVNAQAEQLKTVEHKLSQTDCSFHVDDATAQSIGRKASRICRERNIKIGDCGSTKYGKIGAYPEDILHEVFESVGL